MNLGPKESNLLREDSSDLFNPSTEQRISHDPIISKPNINAENISENTTDHTMLDEKMYMNITSSPRKRLITSPKTKPNSAISNSSQINLTQMIESGNNLLKSIILTLSDEAAYEMSDWGDEDAMKQEDIDQDCSEYDGKPIPSWAQKESLKEAIDHQNQSEGDKLFASLPRRCNLEAVFGTKSIPYYMKQCVTHK